MAVRRANRLMTGPNGGVELVLTRSVEGLGKQGAKVEVKIGYARNYLLPYGLAIAATPHNLRLIEKNKIKLVQHEREQRKQLEKLARELPKHSISIEATANADGHLYGSVGAEEITRTLQKEKLPIDSSMIRLEGPIKELGLYSVKIQLAQGLVAELKVWVVPGAGSER